VPAAVVFDFAAHPDAFEAIRRTFANPEAFLSWLGGMLAIEGTAARAAIAAPTLTDTRDFFRRAAVDAQALADLVRSAGTRECGETVRAGYRKLPTMDATELDALAAKYSAVAKRCASLVRGEGGANARARAALPIATAIATKFTEEGVTPTSTTTGDFVAVLRLALTASLSERNRRAPCAENLARIALRKPRPK